MTDGGVLVEVSIFEFQGGVGKGLHEAGGRDGRHLDHGRDFLGRRWTAGTVVSARSDQLSARRFYFHRDRMSTAGTLVFLF